MAKDASGHGGGNPNHDDKGRFASGGGSGGDAERFSGPKDKTRLTNEQVAQLQRQGGFKPLGLGGSGGSGGGPSGGGSGGTPHSPAMAKALDQIDKVFGKAQSDASPSGQHADPDGLGAHGRTIDAVARGKLPPSTGNMHQDIFNAVQRGMSRIKGSK